MQGRIIITFSLFTKYLELIITAADSIIPPRSIFTERLVCMMCADKQKQTHLISSFCWFNKFQTPESWQVARRPYLRRLHFSYIWPQLCQSCCHWQLVNVSLFFHVVFFPASSVWIQTYFHPSLLSGNLYFSHFTPPLPLDLSCQVSECISHKKAVFFPPLSPTTSLLPGYCDSCLVPFELVWSAVDQQSIALLMSHTPSSSSFFLWLFPSHYTLSPLLQGP